MRLFNLLFVLACCFFPFFSHGQESEKSWAIACAENKGLESVMMITTFNDPSIKKEKQVFQIGNRSISAIQSLHTSQRQPIQFEDTLREYNQDTKLMKQLFFDSRLQALTKSVFLRDELISQQLDFFDKNGRLVRSLEKMPFLEKERVWKFDQTGRKMDFIEKVKDTFEGNHYQSWEKYIYTKDGRLRQVNYLDEKGMTIGYTRYQYDSRGFLKAAYRYQADKLYAKIRFFYE